MLKEKSDQGLRAFYCMENNVKSLFSVSFSVLGKANNRHTFNYENDKNEALLSL